jgi:hypothetical protein
MELFQIVTTGCTSWQTKRMRIARFSLNGEIRFGSVVGDQVTLFPGDVILTGSPAGISRMNHGDSVECEIEGIGVLRNQVA